MMENQEHIDLLMQGADTWNTWRWERRGMQPHLCGAALGNMMLREVDLSYAEYADQDYADLNDIDLHSADMQYATFQGA